MRSTMTVHEMCTHHLLTIAIAVGIHLMCVSPELPHILNSERRDNLRNKVSSRHLLE